LSKRCFAIFCNRGGPRGVSIRLGLGVFVAYLVARKNFGQLPALTVPLCIIASIIFALMRSLSPGTRLTTMAAGTIVFLLLGRLL
jgi:uncharacterized membrane protein YjjP (DUF1212 family)